DEAANRIRDEVDPEANIIVGAAFDQNMVGRMRITVVATGIDAEAVAQPRPAGLSLVASGGRVVSAAAAAAPSSGLFDMAPIRAVDPQWAGAEAVMAEPVLGAVSAMAALAEHDAERARMGDGAAIRAEPRIMHGRTEALAVDPEERPFIAPRPSEAPVR